MTDWLAGKNALVVGGGSGGPPPSFGPVAVRVVGFQLMGALPSVVDGREVAEVL